MYNIVLNSNAAILTFKKSDFEERTKIANKVDKISSAIQQLFNTFNLEELPILFRYKKGDDESDIVTLYPLAYDPEKNKWTEITSPGDISKGMEIRYITKDEYDKYIAEETALAEEAKSKDYPLPTERVLKELQKDYSTKLEKLSPEEEEAYKSLTAPGTIVVIDVENNIPYILTDILSEDGKINYELKDIHTKETKLVSESEIGTSYKIPQKHQESLREESFKKEKEKYDSIREMLSDSEIEDIFGKDKKREDLTKNDLDIIMNELEQIKVEEEKEEQSLEEDASELSTERYDEIRKNVIKQVNKAKDQGKRVTQEAIKNYINGILEKEGIPKSKFWEWLMDEQEFERQEREEAKEMEEKMKTIAKILGVTFLTKTADIITEINPDEEKSTIDKDTGKEVKLTKNITSEGRSLVTVDDEGESKTYDETSTELKDITNDLSEIIAINSEQRKIFANLGYTIQEN